MIRNSLTFVFACVLLLGICVTAYAANPFGSIRVNIPGHSYKIPKKYMNESSLLRYFENLGGMDDSSHSVSLILSNDELIANIPEFQNMVQGYNSKVPVIFSFIVHGMDEDNLEYVQSLVHDKDLWLGEGQYSPEEGGRLVKYDEKTKLYRIYSKNIERLWTFSTLNPITSAEVLPPLNTIVGGCSIRTSATDKPYYRCIHSHDRGNIGLEYWISETNFSLYPQIDELIFKKLDEWEIRRDDQ